MAAEKETCFTMNGNYQHLIAIVFFALLLPTGRISAEPIPIVIVDLGGDLSDDMMDAFTKKTNQSFVRGKDLTKQLGLIDPPQMFSSKQWIDIFDAGESAFFKGQLEEADRIFSNASNHFKSHPETFAFFPQFRQLVFKSILHRAVIAHKKNDTELFDKLLMEAVAFEDIAPSLSEFPPWLCSAFEQKAKLFYEKKDAEITILKKKGCKILVNGQVVQSSDSENKFTFKVLSGNLFVTSQCGKAAPLVQRVEVFPNESVRFNPILLSQTKLEFLSNDVVLKSLSDISDSSISEEYLNEELSYLAQAFSSSELLVLILKNNLLKIKLFNAKSGTSIRQYVVNVSEITTNHMTKAAQVLFAENINSSLPKNQNNLKNNRRRPWYKDWAAWTLALSGAAVLGAGVGMQLSQDMHALQAPIAAALLASGSGFLLTGCVLFFIQPYEKTMYSMDFTLGIGGSF